MRRLCACSFRTSACINHRGRRKKTSRITPSHSGRKTGAAIEGWSHKLVVTRGNVILEFVMKRRVISALRSFTKFVFQKNAFQTIMSEKNTVHSFGAEFPDFNYQRRKTSTVVLYDSQIAATVAKNQITNEKKLMILRGIVRYLMKDTKKVLK